MTSTACFSSQGWGTVRAGSVLRHLANHRASTSSTTRPTIYCWRWSTGWKVALHRPRLLALMRPMRREHTAGTPCGACSMGRCSSVSSPCERDQGTRRRYCLTLICIRCKAFAKSSKPEQNAGLSKHDHDEHFKHGTLAGDVQCYWELALL
jgi:hypothetical protein